MAEHIRRPGDAELPPGSIVVPIGLQTFDIEIHDVQQSPGILVVIDFIFPCRLGFKVIVEVIVEVIEIELGGHLVGNDLRRSRLRCVGILVLGIFLIAIVISIEVTCIGNLGSAFPEADNSFRFFRAQDFPRWPRPPFLDVMNSSYDTFTEKDYDRFKARERLLTGEALSS